MRCQLAADLFQYARRSGVEVKDRKGATFSLDLKGVANSAIVPCLTPHTERRRRAALQLAGAVDWSSSPRCRQRARYRRIAVSPDAYTRVSSFVNLSRSR